MTPDTSLLADHLLNRLADMDGCILCGQPTNSHLVLFAYDDAADELEAVGDLDESDAYGTLCHSDLREHGDAEAAIDAYEDTLRDALEAEGVELADFVNNPEEYEHIEPA